MACTLRVVRACEMGALGRRMTRRAHGLFRTHTHPPTCPHTRGYVSASAVRVMEEWQARSSAIDSAGTPLSSRLVAATTMNERAVFANTSVHLAEIDTYGFDFDYTLSCYTDYLHEWIYAAALRVLVDRLRYPVEMLGMRYDASFPTRGVCFDPAHGTLVKVDATQHIEVATRGKRVLSTDEVRRLYRGGHVRYDNLSSMRMMADLFCYSEICLLSDVIDWLTQHNIGFEPAYIYNDVIASIAEVHVSGLLYNAVRADPARFVQQTRLREFIERLRNGNKHIFILSNSPYDFINSVMQHILGDDWRTLFDVIVLQADKPHFYSSTRHFRRLLPDSGRIDWSPVTRLLGSPAESNVFVGGNLLSFVNMTGFHRVLFTGDHVESDMRDPRRFGWRTAMILSELEADVRVNNSPEYRKELARLLEAREFLSGMYSLSSTLHTYEKGVAFARITREIEETNERMRRLFGSVFGSVFSSGSQPSLFGMRMYRWTDLYTARLENFLTYNLDAFLAPRGTSLLTHDVRASL